MFNIIYSQNVLRSAALVRTLIEKTSLTNEDVVLDIGAGTGIITRELANHCKQVEAIEKDAALCRILRQRFADCANVSIHRCDFINYPLPSFLYKVFANIPYTRTADILRKLLNATRPPEAAYLVVQREAAHKYAGSPFRTENLASLTYRPWFEFRISHDFKPTDFDPIPRVSSVLLGVQKRAQALVKEEQRDLYFDFLAYGFTANKTTLQKAYSQVFGYEQFKRLATNLKFNLHAKPTDLDFDQWIDLFDYFVAVVSEDKKSNVKGARARLNAQQQELIKRHRSRR